MPKQKTTKTNKDVSSLIRTSTLDTIFQLAIEPTLPTEWPTETKQIAELIVRECRDKTSVAIPLLSWYQRGGGAIKTDLAQYKVRVASQMLPTTLLRWMLTAPLNTHEIRLAFIRENRVHTSHRIEQVFLNDTFPRHHSYPIEARLMARIGLTQPVWYMDWAYVEQFWKYFGDTDVNVRRRTFNGLNRWCIECDYMKRYNGSLY